jgi:hypothetical protein
MDGTYPFALLANGVPGARKAMGEQTLVVGHALFGLSVPLKNSDYDTYYLGADKALRRHRSAIDSEYGVSARVFMTQLARVTQRYGGDDARTHLVIECEGEECQLGDDRHDAVELAAIGTAFDNAVIGTGRDQ